MKYMRWDYHQLMDCPDPYLPVLYELIEEEARAQREARLAARGRSR
jgi:hypothetical protein